MDDDRYIIDLRDLELGFSVWQVSIIVTLNSTIQTLPKIGRYLIHSLKITTLRVDLVTWRSTPNN